MNGNIYSLKGRIQHECDLKYKNRKNINYLEETITIMLRTNQRDGRLAGKILYLLKTICCWYWKMGNYKTNSFRCWYEMKEFWENNCRRLRISMSASKINRWQHGQYAMQFERDHWSLPAMLRWGFWHAELILLCCPNGRETMMRILGVLSMRVPETIVKISCHKHGILLLLWFGLMSLMKVLVWSL